MLDISENKKTKYDRTAVFDVFFDSQRENYPYILNGEFINNDEEPFQVNRFYKDSDQLIKSIEKKLDKYDETLAVSFSSYLMNYTIVFNQIARSIYSKGCDAFNNVLEYERQLCYIPTVNASFRKFLEFVYKSYFSIEYKEIVLSSNRCRNVMSSAKLQPFCRKCNRNLSTYNQN